MKYALLPLLLMLTITAARGQCGCARLRVAMDDHRPYQYRYYVPDRPDTTTVVLLTSREYDQKGRNPLHPSLPRGQWLQILEPAYGGWQYLTVPLSQLQPDQSTVRLLVRDAATRQQMQLTFSFRGFDGEEFNLLFDFAPSRHYQLDLNELNDAQWAHSPATSLAPFALTPVAAPGGQQWLKLRKK